MPDPYRDLPPAVSSSAGQQALGAYTRSTPEGDQVQGLTSELGNPADEPYGWNPIGWVANQASAKARALREAGGRIIGGVVDFATDIMSTGQAALTGIPPEAPGPVFDLAAGTAASIARAAPQPIRRALEAKPETTIAGYITLADGTRIPVPKYSDAQNQGERAQTDKTLAAITKANYQSALDQAKVKLAQQTATIQADQWQQAFAIKQREAAQAEEIAALQTRAMELALERETSSPAQRALWGRPSTLAPEQVTKTRKIVGIGPGGFIWG